MDAITKKVIGGLSSLALEEFALVWNLKDDKQKIESIVSAIKAMLKDAEANANNNQVSNWLEDLKDVLFDADDLLDDFSTEALRRKSISGNNIMKKVQIFFSKRNQIAYAFKMGQKMKEIRERLHDIANTRDKLCLESTDHPIESPIVHRRKQTHSFVTEDEIIGREEERNHLKDYLFDANVTEDNVSVSPIVGIGGLGKTVLAQLVYNDNDVQEYFELRMWVCVSDEFDICKIAESIFGETQNSIVEHVQQNLRNKIRGKKYLLVLDDVWNENHGLWLNLKHLLMEGGKGSKIIVTTRSKTVARIMSKYPPVELKGLDHEQSWKLFCREAFDEGKEPSNSELVPIGKDIVKKCGGVPLAIRTTGSLLFSRNMGHHDWLYFRDVGFSKIEHHRGEIFPILKLSYDHLPSNLKSCFAYCSLFPKDYEFYKDETIRLWMAEGLIQLTNDNRCEEDIGDEYFMYLMSRCFFQEVKADGCGQVWQCKMHDLIHDLAKFVAGNEYLALGERKEANIKTRHLSYDFSSTPNGNSSPSLPKGVKIRTLLSVKHSFLVGNVLGQSVFGFVLSLKCLRSLTLDKLDIEEIPKSIKEFKHLRYLRLQRFDRLQKLPSEITGLPNLQTLLVIRCPKVKELPSDINKLKSLRHLVLDPTPLEYMPCGLGELSCLQTLYPFALGPTSSISNLTVLGGLNTLTRLQISRLKWLRDCAPEVKAAMVLLEKQHLRELKLWWFEPYTRLEDEEIAYSDNDEMILQGLQPHPSIKWLVINGFCGESLPDWIGNLSSLITLRISNCNFVTSLPEGIHNLNSLQNLQIIDCPLLEDRCQRERGEDWSKIAHIPNVQIGHIQDALVGWYINSEAK